MYHRCLDSKIMHFHFSTLSKIEIHFKGIDYFPFLKKKYILNIQIITRQLPPCFNYSHPILLCLYVILYSCLISFQHTHTFINKRENKSFQRSFIFSFPIISLNKNQLNCPFSHCLGHLSFWVTEKLGADRYELFLLLFLHLSLYWWTVGSQNQKAKFL